MIFPFLDKGETLEGKTFNVEYEHGYNAPHIHMKYRKEGKKVPETEMFMSKYAMRLEFGQIEGGALSGKIYLCLPDEEKSFVAGTFRAALKQ